MAEITEGDLTRCLEAVFERMASTADDNGLEAYFAAVGIDPAGARTVALTIGMAEEVEGVGADLPMRFRLAMAAIAALAVGIEAQRDREMRTAAGRAWLAGFACGWFSAMAGVLGTLFL